MIAKTDIRTPAVAYYRMSTDRQEASIPAQREAVEKFAKQHGYRIDEEYIDEGISGDATDKRRRFQQMIADAERGTFAAILCWDIDRFGRFDSIEAGHWIYPLRKAGVHLATVAQGVIDWTDFSGRIMYGIQQESKNQYLTDLSRNVTRGMTRLAEQGKWPGGKPAIGYVCREKRLELGAADEVALVRRLFAEYLAGKSLQGLADELNVEGRLSPRGGKWSASAIATILRNHAYLGDFIWNHRCMSKYKRRGPAASEVNSEAEWIVFEDHHPAIIDRQTFDRVQEQLSARKNCSTPHPNSGGFVLSGLLVCGKCGSKMAGDVCQGVHRYSCYGYKHYGKHFCDRNGLRQQVILDAILEAVERNYYNPKTMERLAAACRRQLRRQARRPDAGKLRAELAAVEGKLIKASRRLVEVDADMLEVVQEQIRGLRARKEAISDQLRLATAPAAAQGNAIEAKVQAALAWFSRLKEAASKAEPNLLRQFIREAFEKVELWAAKKQVTPRRYQYRLERGCIYLKSDNLSITAI